MNNEVNPFLALYPSEHGSKKARKHKRACGKMHTKTLGSYANAPDVKLRQYEEASTIPTRYLGIKVILRDNIQKNAEAAINCEILAKAEACEMKPDLYTQKELMETVLTQDLRNAGIKINKVLTF